MVANGLAAGNLPFPLLLLFQILIGRPSFLTMLVPNVFHQFGLSCIIANEVLGPASGTKSTGVPRPVACAKPASDNKNSWSGGGANNTYLLARAAYAKWNVQLADAHRGLGKNNANETFIGITMQSL